LILQHIPDFNKDPEKFVGKRVCVIGAGASAITCINALQRLISTAGASSDLLWVVRRENAPYVVIDGDPLPQRARLYAQGNAFYSSDHAIGDEAPSAGLRVKYLKGYNVREFHETAGKTIKIALEKAPTEAAEGAGGGGGGSRSGGVGGVENVQEEEEVDVVISCCGFRPDDSVWQEVQVHQCYAAAALSY
jgi:hypothetical protein